MRKNKNVAVFTILLCPDSHALCCENVHVSPRFLEIGLPSQACSVGMIIAVNFDQLEPLKFI